MRRGTELHELSQGVGTRVARFAWLVVCPPPARLRPRATLDPKSRIRESSAVRLPARNSTAVGVMFVCASTAPCHRALWERQTRGLRTQEAKVAQCPDCWACVRTCDNAYRVPRLFDRCRRFGLRHASRLADLSCRGERRRSDFTVGQTTSCLPRHTRRPITGPDQLVDL